MRVRRSKDRGRGSGSEVRVGRYAMKYPRVWGLLACLGWALGPAAVQAQIVTLSKSINPPVAQLGDTVTVCLHVASPSSRPMADIVWALDVSNSMVPYLAIISADIQSFTAQLASEGIDYRNGLVAFSDNVQTFGFTPDDGVFKAWVGSLTTYGGDEQDLGALMAADGLGWRGGASRTIILVTDEQVDCLENYLNPNPPQTCDPNYNDPYYLSDVLARMTADHVAVHVISNNSSAIPCRCNPYDIPPATHGLFLPITAPKDQWTTLLDTLGSRVAQVTNAVLSDPLPPELAPVSPLPGGGSVSGQTVSWLIPALTPGVPYDVCFWSRVVAPISGYILNTAQLASDQFSQQNSNQAALYAPGADTLTPTPSDTPTPTYSPTPSPTGTVTEYPTYTPTWTVSPTFTTTVTPTSTVTLTPTPTDTPLAPLRVWPNPFNPWTAVRGTLKCADMPEGSTFNLYTVSGERVFRAGEAGYRVEWDGKTQGGKIAAPGIYCYTVTRGMEILQKGVLVIRTDP